jgi:hypothetical protein
MTTKFPMGVLCVIDMQPAAFIASRDSTLIEKVIEEIKISMKKGEYIIIVDYKNCGETNQDILNNVIGYQFVRYVTKAQDDGSEEIVETMKNFTLTSKETIKVCGVNTWACVLRTFEGLAEKLPHSTIVVLEDVCGEDGNGESDEDEYKTLTEYYISKRLRYNDTEQVLPHNIKSRKRRQLVMV